MPFHGAVSAAGRSSRLNPTTLYAIITFVFGAMVGSFLNVVIWRLPRGGVRALNNPPRSECPSCKHQLSALDNIPLASFLALRARCRYCGKAISWRYFGVELLTALLFVALFWKLGWSVDLLAYCLFTAALVASLFIDLALFIIPDELNSFALFIGVAHDLYRAFLHDPDHALLWGWLPRSILGAVVCAATFVFIQLFGYALFRKDAMGDGDVKLARAIGAMMPLRLALISFLLAIAAGAVLGVALIAWQATRPEPEATDEPDTEEPPAEDEEPLTLGDRVLAGLAYMTFFDLVYGFVERLRGRPAPAGEREDLAEEDFAPGPTHIPFGPYMVVGALASLFVGDFLLNWYLRFAHLAPGG